MDGDNHLLFPPLCPGVPGEGDGKAKEGNSDKQPEQTIQEAELTIKNISDPVDGAVASVLLCSLPERVLLVQLSPPHVASSTL